MTERRIVVIAFFAFLAVGSAVILVYAAQPTSHPSIQSGRGAATTRSHRATTSSTTRRPSPTPHRGGGRVCDLGYRDAGLHTCTSDDGTAHRGGTPQRRAPDHGPADDRAARDRAAHDRAADDRAADDRAADDRAAHDRAADDRAAHHRAAQHRTAHHGSPVDEKDPARPSQEVSALGPRNERAFDHRSGPTAGDPDPRTLPRSARSGASARRIFSGGVSSGGAALSPMAPTPVT